MPPTTMRIVTTAAAPGTNTAASGSALAGTLKAFASATAMVRFGTVAAAARTRASASGQVFELSGTSTKIGFLALATVARTVWGVRVNTSSGDPCAEARVGIADIIAAANS